MSPTPIEPTTLQQQVHQLLDSNKGFASRLLNLLLMLLIFLNVIAVVVESMRPVYLEYKMQFDTFELISVIVFTVEYLLRIWSAPANPAFQRSRFPRLAFARSGMAVVDLLAIAPFYVGMFIGLDARVLRGLRLFRVFKLTRYSNSMDLLATVIRKELPSIGSALFVMAILIVLAASGIYVVEREVQPDDFGSIPAALWWATVTLTTVGYGDVVPQTPLGRGFGMLLMITGVGMAALPAGILAAGYSRELSLRREQYEAQLKLAMEDGEIDHEERRTLESLRGLLGLSVEETEAQRATIEKKGLRAAACPHCGKLL